MVCDCGQATSVVTETERCFHTTPSDAYDNLSDYILIGSLYDSSDMSIIKAMDLARTSK